MNNAPVPNRSPFAPHRWPFHFLLYVQLVAVLTAGFIVSTFGRKWGATSREKGFTAPTAIPREK